MFSRFDGPQSDERSTLVAGRFHVEELVAEGGVSRLSRARDAASGQLVALKTFLPHLMGDASLHERFLREARLAAESSDAHVVKVIAAGVDSVGSPYLVMEWLEGETLASRLRTRAPLEGSLAIGLCAQALTGLESVHRAGVVHRDLKPDNLFLVASPTAPFLKILDFGVAALLGGAQERDLTPAGRAMGTPEYASPEALRGEDVDARADLYALTVVLFEMLTGHRPFVADSWVALAERIHLDPPTPLAAFLRDVPPPLERFVARGLAKERHVRFASAAEMREALLALDVA